MTTSTPTKRNATANRLFGLFYAAGALVIFFFPAEFLYLINVGPKVFRITEAIPDSTESFWRVLATALMVNLSALCFLAAESPKIRGYSMLHLLTKIVAGCGFLWLFLNHQRLFAYIMGATFEFLGVLVVAWVTFRAGTANTDRA